MGGGGGRAVGRMAVGAVQRSAGSDRRRVGGATKARQVTAARPPAAALGPETTSAAIEAVAGAGTPAAHGRGHVFYRPAAVAETLFVLLEGRVVVYRLSAAGRRLTLATLHAGEVFGEA